MKLALLSSELTPFAKTGGLGDAVAGLARFLARQGSDVRVFLPLYSRIRTQGHELLPVSFLREAWLTMGGKRYPYSVHTTRLPDSELWIYLVHCPPLYERSGIYASDGDEHLRFAFLSRAAIECCQRMGWAPDVFHCNDWHTALVPLYLKALYGWDRLFARTHTLLTLHNLGYQGAFPAAVLGDLDLAADASLLHQEDLAAGRINFLKTGILYTDVLSTVSRTYALEIQTEAYGMGLHELLRRRADHLVGIVNGVDYGEWDPATDPLLPYHYSPNNLAGKLRNKESLLRMLGLGYQPGVPTVGVVSRLTEQKGFDLLFEPLPDILARRDLRFVALGNGERRYEEFFVRLQASFPGKVCYYRGYSNELAHLIEAGSDLFLMPSRYEPCGLNQMYSLRYGTPPVVRRTGGLADTVEPYDPAAERGTGFVFEHFTADGLRWGLESALDAYRDRPAWRDLMLRGMAQDFSWDRQGREYLELYAGLVAGRW